MADDQKSQANSTALKPGTKKYANRRLSALKSEREPWLAECKEISRMIKPRRGKFDGNLTQRRKTPNPRTTDIVNGTAAFALRTAVSGMMAGNTSPARAWMKLGLEDGDLEKYSSVKIWLADAQRSMLDLFRKTNLYGALPKIYEEEILFGTAACIALDDPQKFLRFFNFTFGTYCLGIDHRGIVDTLYREFQMSALQMARQFGVDRMSRTAKNLLDKNPDALIPMVFCVEPRDNIDIGKLDALNMPYASLWFEQGGRQDEPPLYESGFRRFPVLAPRWDLNEGDAYGSGLGIDALGDVKGLQFQSKQKALNVDKMGNPALGAPSSLRNKPVGQMPGDIVFYDSATPGLRVEPLFKVDPQAIKVLSDDCAIMEDRIRKAFYVDTFMMLAQRDTGERPTAREVDELHSEKMIELGPVVERQQADLQAPLIELTFEKMLTQSRLIWSGKMDGKPLLLPPPKELKDAEFKIEFISALAQAQKSIGMASIERVMTFAGNISQATQDPSHMDTIDVDRAILEYSDMSGAPPVITRDMVQVEQLREQRQKQQQQQQAMAAADPMSKAVKNVGAIKTDEDNLVAKALGGGKKK